jgi:hypothetical protein
MQPIDRPLPVRPLSAAEEKLVNKIDTTWTRGKALSELKANLQTAVEVELSTLPLYLYTYYSISRTPEGFPDTPLSRFADQAGGVIMSVAVEEMLHMSLVSNILFSLGHMPEIYLHSPSPYPTDLPGHAKLGPNHKKLELPLAKFSLEQMWHFLEVEYPAAADAPPEDANWQTIGQLYSYIRCIISSKLITDEDFTRGAGTSQIQSDNYSPNSIDSVYPKGSFNAICPIPAPEAGSAATVAVFPDDADSHAGKGELITIHSKHTAMQAIETIDAQGEGFQPAKFPAEKDDDLSGMELSHYYKFLTLQASLKGYDPEKEPVAKHPKPPRPAETQFSPNELANVVYAFPDNPVAAAYPPGRKEAADVVSGLYQYMLILTESIFKQPPDQQKIFFNQALHRSMIWILDKIIRAMRQVNLNDGGASTSSQRLAPTFENVDLGPRSEAFANLNNMVANLNAEYGAESWYTSELQGYINMIPTLTDVSSLWTPSQPGCPTGQYKGIPKFPATPPATVAEHEARHACLGLNECKGQGRTRDNDCAGQGYCSTALEYNYADPSTPTVSDHTCHVQNNCAGQGGCGLYGTGAEQDLPGANRCATLGSCATPINAERFSTDGPNTRKSVWLRARAVFTEQKWPQLREKNPQLPPQPPVANVLFEYGPTIEWIEDYSGEGMTACGSSGMSGAHSCA